MPQRITFLSLWVLVGFAACARDAPTAAESPSVAGLPHEDLSGLMVAIEDVRSRILPSLGSGAPVQALADALDQLEAAFSGAGASAPDGAVRRAEVAAAQLRAEARLRPDVDVVLLVLERITAVAPGPTSGERREQ